MDNYRCLSITPLPAFPPPLGLVIYPSHYTYEKSIYQLTLTDQHGCTVRYLFVLPFSGSHDGAPFIHSFQQMKMLKAHIMKALF